MEIAYPETTSLYQSVPGVCTEVPVLSYYRAPVRKSDAAVVIFPGGGYGMRANHEGDGYARMLNRYGVDAFVCEYRVAPHILPAELLDARRAVRVARSRATALGIDPHKIAVMGSSAGGHLAALCATYTAPLEGEHTDDIDDLPFLPDLQILCYPVISSDPAIGHKWSYSHLTGSEDVAVHRLYDPELLVTDQTPPAFLWHTSTDTGVNVRNSLRYADVLIRHHVLFEAHIFPVGGHGLGCAENIPHVAQWTVLLANYLGQIGWISSVAEG